MISWNLQIFYFVHFIYLQKIINIKKSMEVDEESAVELPILPEKVWHKIFDYLSYERLKTATLVSKTWNVLISNFPRFIHNTRLQKDGITTECWRILKSSQRSYRCVTINFTATKYLTMSLPLWTNLTHLELYECTVVGSKLLIILSQLPTITALMIHRIKIVKRNNLSDPIKLRLVNLCLEHKNVSTDWIFDHLHCTRVSNYLKLWGSWSSKSDAVVKFLNRLKGHTNNVHLVRIDLDYLEHAIVAELDFTWGYLKVDSYENKDMIISDLSLNLRKICEASSSVNSAFNLSMGEDEHQDQNFQQILKFIVGDSISSFEFVGELKYLRSSDFLSIGKFIAMNSLKFQPYQSNDDYPAIDAAFFSMFPHVRNLTLDSMTIDYFYHLDMEFICSELKFIENLKIEFNASDDDDYLNVLNSIRFSNLKSIAICPLEIITKNIKIIMCEKFREFLSFHESLEFITLIDKRSSLDSKKCDEFLQHFSKGISSSSVRRINVVRVQISNDTQFKWDEGPTQESLNVFASIDM